MTPIYATIPKGHFPNAISSEHHTHKHPCQRPVFDPALKKLAAFQKHEDDKWLPEHLY